MNKNKKNFINLPMSIPLMFGIGDNKRRELSIILTIIILLLVLKLLIL